MNFNRKRMPTVMNCPTRAALERKPGDPGFLVESIHARHTEQKRSQHLANIARRASENQARGRRIVKQPKGK